MKAIVKSRCIGIRRCFSLNYAGIVSPGSILTLFYSLLITSCSFNKLFLKPAKITQTAKKARIYGPNKKDTTTIIFSGNIHQPTFSGKNLNGIDLLSVSSVLFNNSSGRLLNGWMIKVTGDLSPEITLLHFHGNEGSLVSHYQAITPLVKKGVQVFMFDYSGFGFSAGEATQEQILADALSALNYVRNRADVKNTRLIIYGQSIGGHMAAVVAAARESAVSGLVMEGAFSSPKDIAAFDLRRYIGIGFPARILVYTPYSAFLSLKQYHKPVLIIHSTEDKVVPYAMALKLFSAANQPKQLYTIKGPHINGAILYSDSILFKIKAMIAQ